MASYDASDIVMFIGRIGCPLRVYGRILESPGTVRIYGQIKEPAATQGRIVPAGSLSTPGDNQPYQPGESDNIIGGGTPGTPGWSE